MRYQIIFSAVVLALAGAALTHPLRAATCGPDNVTIANAEIAFVGMLTSANAVGDLGTFAVTEVWGAAQLPPVVTVSGMPGQWGPSSTDAAQRFIVLAMADGDTLVVRNECDVAQPTFAFQWEDSFAVLRPATAHPPFSQDAVREVPVQLFLVGGAAVLIGVISFFAFRRRPEAGR